MLDVCFCTSDKRMTAEPPATDLECPDTLPGDVVVLQLLETASDEKSDYGLGDCWQTSQLAVAASQDFIEHS